MFLRNKSLKKAFDKENVKTIKRKCKKMKMYFS